jgi:hypothetical protein
MQTVDPCRHPQTPAEADRIRALDEAAGWYEATKQLAAERADDRSAVAMRAMRLDAAFQALAYFLALT